MLHRVLTHSLDLETIVAPKVAAREVTNDEDDSFKRKRETKGYV
jgi:hypothetical protein